VARNALNMNFEGCRVIFSLEYDLERAAVREGLVREKS
jgi:hypothetical protein